VTVAVSDKVEKIFRTPNRFCEIDPKIGKEQGESQGDITFERRSGIDNANRG
jgi:hypothetical protein